MKLTVDDGTDLATEFVMVVVRDAPVATLDGDYDGNQSVHGSDFLRWQREMDSGSGTSADGNHDGTVGYDDLMIWQGNYGAAVAPAEGENGHLSGAAYLAWQRAYGEEPSSAAASMAPAAPVDAELESQNSMTAELVDAAMAIQWLDDAGEEQAPIVFTHPEVGDSRVDVRRTTPPTRNAWPTRNSGAEEPLPSGPAEQSKRADDSWLSDETLERVFSI